MVDTFSGPLCDFLRFNINSASFRIKIVFFLFWFKLPTTFPDEWTINIVEHLKSISSILLFLLGLKYMLEPVSIDKDIVAPNSIINKYHIVKAF